MNTLYKGFTFLIISSLVLSCQSKFLKIKEEPDNFSKLEEFDKKVTIKEVMPPAEVPASVPLAAQVPDVQIMPAPEEVKAAEEVKPNEETKTPEPKKVVKPAPPKKVKEEPKSTKKAPVVVLKPREPSWEDLSGFPEGQRRPIKDPFRVGEKVVHSVRYFKATAGKITFSIPSMVEVNGKKAYRLFTRLETEGIFERFYSIDDWAETLMDFDTLVPTVFSLHVKESAQLKEARALFDPVTSQATYWEKKYTEEKGHKEKKVSWKMLAYSQNVFSAAYYQRMFDYQVGKKYQFNVADDGKNIMFSAKCLRKETIETEAGTFKTIVIKPEFSVGGVFQPSGDILFWLTDDDRKLLVRIESDIKIGTLVTEAISVNP